MAGDEDHNKTEDMHWSQRSSMMVEQITTTSSSLVTEMITIIYTKCIGAIGASIFCKF